MPQRGNFLLIPWQGDFLSSLLDLALRETDGDIGRAVFIFPNNRPEKYLSRLIRKHETIRRPLIMPRMLTVNGLFSLLRSRIMERPAWNAGLLDRVGLLLACVRAEQEPPMPGKAEWNFLSDAGLFFPWGLRLAALFEECFSQRRVPADFHHAEGAVSPFAASLLSRLGRIFTRYVAGLDEKDWTTPGRDASLVADYIAEHARLPGDPLGRGPVFIAGFHALSGTENILFRQLWEQGANVLIHADPALAQSKGRENKAHWSCAAFPQWAREWRTGIELLPHCGNSIGKEESKGSETSGAKLRYYQAFDLHSQLTVLEEELSGLADSKPLTAAEASAQNEEDREVDTVVVLPDSALLMPVLHHLPRTDINISMGYPLSRSPLFRLLDTIARLQEGRRGKGYYWRDLLDLIRHPYLKMLRPEGGDDDEKRDNIWESENKAPLRRELYRLERVLREHGRKYPEPLSILEQTYQMLEREELPSAEILALLEKLFSVCLIGFEDKTSPCELGAALENLCSLLLESGGHLWERFLIDAECLFRIMQSLIPELKRSALSEERFLPQSLYGVLRRLMQAERVPFEASPLVGLQVMGMLETRLLNFRRVLVLDCGEHSLPGSPPGDPLLPEALRPELGLPPLSSREQVTAYHFFRLLAGAEEILLLWEEGSDAPGIQEQKKKKSRFVEELLWQEEKKLGRLLAERGRDGPLTVLSAPVSPIPRHMNGIAVNEHVRDAMARLLRGPVSATMLDAYLRCPVQFYYQRLALLSPVDEIREGDDPLAVGDIFHKALQEAYTPYLGKSLPGGKELLGLMGEELEAAVFASSDYTRLLGALPADSAAMLACAAKKRLENYLLHQGPGTVLALESKFSSPFAVAGDDFTLYGKVDRIDLRPFCDEHGEASPGIVILDYKTGRIPGFRVDVWHNGALWERLAAWRPGKADGQEPENDILHELAENMESVQLPFYLLLYSLQAETPQQTQPYDAAWVELARLGEEIHLFPKKFYAHERRDSVANHCSLLVHFLLRHMLQSEHLFPRPGTHCRWCSSAKLCISGSK